MQDRQRRKYLCGKAVGFFLLRRGGSAAFADDVSGKYVPQFMCGSPFPARLMAKAGVQYAKEPSVGEQAESAPAGVGVELLPGNVVDPGELIVGDYLYPEAVRQ